ncbi:MAG: molybdopterin biosynthesis protein, partial [Eubacteriales bacterium]|nr:molybdopterin biosynthesis protein [Eubacteriales bacterium]
TVVKMPTVAIIPTGDEIVPPCANPRPGDIMEFNSSIFSGMLRQWGAKPVVCPIVKDTFQLIFDAVSNAVENYDMVILNAGSSAGREDYSAQVIAAVGNVLYHGIAIKPGKPAVLGHCGAKPILGVPGYPVSGIIVIEQFLRPILAEYYQTAHVKPEQVQAVLSKRLVSGLKYQEFVRVRLGLVEKTLVATPLNRGSGVISSFMKADGILSVPQETEGYEAGETVAVTLLRPKYELENTLVAIGSHDPLLDELANLLHITCNDMFMSSSHVGSMGGIMAVRRKEAHIAGCHLLDEDTGEYNVGFIKKYFPEGGVRLVECVMRAQGLMLQNGNPLHVTSISDIANGKLRYVNRQKGSGTRVLLDYLLKKNGLRQENIYGYGREEFTHTAVAAQIASGSADVGMGIYSAASMYGLDFLSVCQEQYDLLIPDYAWDTPMVALLLELLKSEQFKNKLLQMGGYGVENPGRVRVRL